MASNTARSVIGTIGCFTTFCILVSPAPTFKKIIRNASVGQHSVIPYMAILGNCALWLLYGREQPDSTSVVVINGIGVAIELIYLGIFLRYSAGVDRRRLGFVLGAEGAVVGVVAALVFGLAHGEERRSSWFGGIGVASAICMYASPLSIMKTVFQTKSVEQMSLALSAASLANAIFWTIYSFIGRFDLYVFIPNIVGSLFALAQLAVYAYFTYNRGNDAQVA